MSTEGPLPVNHPAMVAWERYKATEEFANVKRWAVDERHTQGSLWAAFHAGWSAAHPPATDIAPNGTVHQLKTWPEHFGAVIDGSKTVEMRRDDRGFKVGDILDLREFHPGMQTHSGRSVRRLVTHIVRDGRFGVCEGHVAMSIREIAQQPATERAEAERAVIEAARRMDAAMQRLDVWIGDGMLTGHRRTVELTVGDDRDRLRVALAALDAGKEG